MSSRVVLIVLAILIVAVVAFGGRRYYTGYYETNGFRSTIYREGLILALLVITVVAMLLRGAHF